MITGTTMTMLVNQSRGMCYIIALLAVFSAGSTTAAGSQGLSLSLEDDQKQGWSGSTSVGILSSTMNPAESDYVSQALFSADLSREFFAGWRGGLAIRATKDLINERANRFSSANLRISKSLLSADEGLDLNLALAYYVPVEKVELRYDTYRGAFGVTPSASYTLKSGPLTDLSLLGNLTALRRFYRYTSTQGGFSLVKESLSVSVGLAYALTSQWNLGVQFANTQAWDFDGEAFRSEYSSTQTVNYKWSPKLSIGVGHTTGGYTFGYTGIDYDVRLYDRYSSKIFAAVSYSI